MAMSSEDSEAKLKDPNVAFKLSADVKPFIPRHLAQQQQVSTTTDIFNVSAGISSLQRDNQHAYSYQDSSVPYGIGCYPWTAYYAGNLNSQFITPFVPQRLAYQNNIPVDGWYNCYTNENHKHQRFSQPKLLQSQNESIGPITRRPHGQYCSESQRRNVDAGKHFKVIPNSDSLSSTNSRKTASGNNLSSRKNVRPTKREPSDLGLTPAPASNMGDRSLLSKLNEWPLLNLTGQMNECMTKMEIETMPSQEKSFASALKQFPQKCKLDINRPTCDDEITDSQSSKAPTAVSQNTNDHPRKCINKDFIDQCSTRQHYKRRVKTEKVMGQNDMNKLGSNFESVKKQQTVNVREKENACKHIPGNQRMLPERKKNQEVDTVLKSEHDIERCDTSSVVRDWPSHKHICETDERKACNTCTVPFPERMQPSKCSLSTHKKKSKSQLRQEFAAKMRTLPSVQGKVLFITEELHNIFTGDKKPDLQGSDAQLKSSDFPTLRDDPLQEADEDWSDLDGDDPNSCQITNSQTTSYESEFPSLNHSNSTKLEVSGAKRNYSNVVHPKKLNVCSTSLDLAKEFEKISLQSRTRNNITKETITNLNTKTGTPVPVRSKHRKANEAIQLSVFDLLVKKKKSMPANGRTTFRISKATKKVIPVVANILDSSSPARRRGKERENPSVKRPSALKKVILKEREAKKLLKLQEQQSRSVKEQIGNNSAMEQASVLLSDPQPSTSLLTAKDTIHSSKFREYCDQLLTPEIDQAVTMILQNLIRFQDRLYHKDPIKARMRRRMVLGLREVTKHLKLRKLKCIIMAPNLERIRSEGGLDDATRTLIHLTEEQEIPLVYSLSRKALGKVCLKKVPISCIGIFNYSGVEETYKKLMDLVGIAREGYTQILENSHEKPNDTSTGQKGY